MSEVVLLLPNTDCLQQDYVRGCTTSTKYWLPSTRLCQRLYYFYQILTAFNKIMSEVVLLLPNTDCLQQDYVRGCTTSTKYWLPSTRLCQRLYYFYQILTAFNKIMSEVVLLLPNTDCLHTRLCQRLYYFYQILTAFNKIMSEVVLLLPNTDCLQQDYVRGCTTSTKYWLPSTRLCQRLYYFYQILTAFNKIMSEVVLLLPNTDCLQQDYVRGCTTSTKYWLPSTRLCQRLYYFYQIMTAFNKIMSEVVLLLPNTDCLQQDYVRGCTTSTKYWLPSTRLCQRLYYFYQILTAFNQIMSEVVLLLPNTDCLQQDYVRGCTTSTKYWLPSTRLCQRLYYFYQILTAFNKIMSEVVLLLPNTDCLQQDYVRGCTTSTKYWLPSTRLCQRLYYFYQILTAFNKIMSEVVLLLPNTDCLQPDYVRGCTTSTKYWLPSTRLCQRLYYFYQILTAFNKIMSEVVLLLPNTDCLQQDYVRGCTTSTKYWLPSTRLCQRLYYFYQILTAFNKIISEVVLLLPNTDCLQPDYVRGCTTSTKYWLPSTRLCQRLYYFYQILTAFNKIMSEVVLLLPNTDCLQQDYVRGCTTSTKYWLPSTRLCQRLYYFYQILTAFNKIMSEVVLLLPNTDCLQQDYVRGCTTSTKYWLPSTRLCQRLYYFYQILTAFNKIMSEVVLLLPNTDCLQQDYVRGCTTSTKYWLPSTRLCQRLFYFYQILTAFNKIMSEVVLLLPNTDCLQQDYVRGCTTSTKYWLPSTRLCQRLYYFYQILTAFNKIMSEVVLLLPNTDCLQQDYVRGCTTSTKYGLPSTRLCQRLYYFYQIRTAFNKIMSEVVLLLPNTDCLQQDYVRGCTTSTKYWLPSTRLCQRLYYFYQILTAFNKIMSEVVLLLPNTDCLQQDYVRGCTTSTKYGLPSTRLCQRLYYFYQIRTAFNKIMSEVVLLLPNTDCLQQDYVRGCTTSTKY